MLRLWITVIRKRTIYYRWSKSQLDQYNNRHVLCVIRITCWVTTMHGRTNYCQRQNMTSHCNWQSRSSNQVYFPFPCTLYRNCALASAYIALKGFLKPLNLFTINIALSENNLHWYQNKYFFFLKKCFCFKKSVFFKTAIFCFKTNLLFCLHEVLVKCLCLQCKVLI